MPRNWIIPKQILKSPIRPNYWNFGFFNLGLFWPKYKTLFYFQLGDVDPDDLLSFLDPPPDLSTPPSSGSGMSSGGPNDSGQNNMGGYQHGSNSNESNNPNSNLTDEDELLSLIDYDWTCWHDWTNFISDVICFWFTWILSSEWNKNQKLRQSNRARSFGRAKILLLASEDRRVSWSNFAKCCFKVCSA